jgi:O-antigen ligase
MMGMALIEHSLLEPHGTISLSQPWVYLLALLLVPAVLAAVVVVWKRPALGAAGTLILLMIPQGTGAEGQSLALASAADVASAFFAGLVALKVLASGDLERLNSWVVLPGVGFLVAGSLSTIMAYDPTLSLIGLIRFAQIFVVVPLATYLALQSRKDLRLILGTVLALGLIEGAIGTVQSLTGTGAGFAGSSVRAVGTLGEEGVMSMAMLVTYAMIVAIALYAGLRDRRRWLGLLLALALAFPLVASLSRGFWIAAAVGVVVVLFLSQPRRAAVLVVAGGLVVAMLAGVAGEGSGVLEERFSSIFTSFSPSTADQSVKDRYALWTASVGMWTNHPVTGVGIKNFPIFMNTYIPLSFAGGTGASAVEIQSPHNMYMLVLSEQGFLGILAFMVFLSSLGVGAVRRLGSLEKSSTEGIFGLVVLGFLATYLISSLYGDFGGSTMVLDAVLFGCLIWLASGVEPVEGKGG